MNSAHRDTHGGNATRSDFHARSAAASSASGYHLLDSEYVAPSVLLNWHLPSDLLQHAKVELRGDDLGCQRGHPTRRVVGGVDGACVGDHPPPRVDDERLPPRLPLLVVLANLERSVRGGWVVLVPSSSSSLMQEGHRTNNNTKRAHRHGRSHFKTHLRCCQHVALILDRACTEQRLPVRATGRHRKGRGHEEQLRPMLHQAGV